MRFLSIGECMAELAPTEAPGQFKLGFGGDSFNTAWYMRELRPDASVSYFTAVGDDLLSRQMLDEMANQGVLTDKIARIPGKSVGLYMIAIENGERSFSYWRDTSAARHLANDPVRLDAALDDADLIYFSGITLAILDEAGRAALFNALKKARHSGKKIAFDPNLRPRLWKSAEEMTVAIMEGSRVSDIVLPSFDDEATYFFDRNSGQTVERYAKAGAAIVVVKDGSGAVRFSDSHESGEVVIAPVDGVIDTTAAGDSFNAGFLAQLYDGKALADCISCASQVASHVIRHRGALVPLHSEKASRHAMADRGDALISRQQ